MRQAIPNCPADETLRVIGGRWKGLILWYLFQGTRRFSELRRLVPTATQKMLTQGLRELERDGVVHREVYPQVPPRVEYSLTPRGESLRPVLEAMSDWGRRWPSTPTEPTMAAPPVPRLPPPPSGGETARPTPR